MNKNTNKYIILDVETAKPTKKDMTKTLSDGSVKTYYQDAIGLNLCYDIGYKIVNEDGHTILNRNYVVKEIFDNSMFMNSAYYTEKIPQYVIDIVNGKRKVATIRNIQKEFAHLVEKYNVQKLYAYNANFDKNSLNDTMRYITKKDTKEQFIPQGLEIGCIWHLACQALCNTDKYRKFCEENGYISKTGNYQTSAEIVHRFLSGDNNFVEKHTGLEDVKIEKNILFKCWDKSRKLDDSINTHCWKIPQIKKEVHK